MIWLLASIVCNSLLFIILRSYPKFGVDPFRAIVINYFVAGGIAFFWGGLPQAIGEIQHQEWLNHALVTGLLFILVFILISRTAILSGVSVAGVANKMSFVLPLGVSVLIFNESISGWAIAGMIIALFSVVLVSVKPDNPPDLKGVGLLLAILVFIGSGIIDGLVNYVFHVYFPRGGAGPYISISFLTAGTAGAIWMVLNKMEPGRKEILGGIVLGIPNFFSILSLMNALGDGFITSGLLYPINNVGIVLASALGGLFLFREKFSRMNTLGIALAILAIFLVTL
jgi:drug/metabolite transporter (DMT)-like permease